MIKTINEHQFIDAFMSSDTYKNNFSRSGLRALYEYLTEYEDSTDSEIELDIVAICCDFSEYNSALDCAKDYGYDEQLQAVKDSNEEDTIEEESEADALAWLEERTTVIPFDGVIELSDGTKLGNRGVIIQQF